MKHLKTKLMASAAMLMVATVMITSASFAWFTISTAPEISAMTNTVVTNENLEIALSNADRTAPAETTQALKDGDKTPVVTTGDAYTWGNLVDLSSGDAKTAYDRVDKTMRPMTYDATNKKWLYPTYGDDGRIKAVDQELTKITSWKAGTETAAAESAGFGQMTDAKNNVYGYFVDYWVRTNVGGDLKLATTGVDRGTGVTGSGSKFTSAGKTTADTAMAKGMSVAFSIGTYDSTKKEWTWSDPVVATKTTTDAVAEGTGATEAITTYSINTSESSKDYYSQHGIGTIAANTATLVRMFVYLEGKDITNAAASINGTDDKGTGAISVNGTLNIQFCMDGVDAPMAMPNDKATS